MKSKRIAKLVLMAQREAAKSIKKGNPPFGAVLTDRKGSVIARAHNTQYSSNDPSAHAEINLLRKAGKKLKTCDLAGYRLFSNAESCSMCLSAGIKANIRHYYYGAPHEAIMDPDLPAVEVASRSKNEIHLYPDIRKESCIAQIKHGRSKEKKILN